MTISEINTICRGCNAPLTPYNDSEAHIIPKALGGRLAPKGLICRKCNTALDSLADNALIEAFGAWPTLMDISRQGGGNPSKLIESREGNKIRLETDGSTKQIDVVYDVTPLPEGHEVVIAAGDMKTFRQLLKRAAKDFPEFDTVAAEQYAKITKLPPDSEIKMSLHFSPKAIFGGVITADSEIKMSLNFSPKAIFGGVITAIWLFLIKETGRAFMDWDRLLACIKIMQTNGGTFRYFVDGLPGLQGPRIDIGHKIIVRSIPSTGELIAYVEILGILKIGGLFAKSPYPGYELEHIYAYDTCVKRERTSEFSIDPSIFEHQNWNTIGLGPTDESELKSHFRGALNIFVAHYRKRFSSK